MKQTYYSKFTAKEVADAMDARARRTVLLARLLGLATILVFVAVCLIGKSIYNIYALIALVLIIVTFAFGYYLMYLSFLKAVWREKKGRNKELYKKHKKYFDIRFVNLGLLSKKPERVAKPKEVRRNDLF